MRVVHELGKAAILDLGQVIVDVVAAQRIRCDLVRPQVLPKERVHDLNVRRDDVCAGDALIGNDDGWIQAGPPALRGSSERHTMAHGLASVSDHLVTGSGRPAAFTLCSTGQGGSRARVKRWHLADTRLFRLPPKAKWRNLSKGTLLEQLRFRNRLAC